MLLGGLYNTSTPHTHIPKYSNKYSSEGFYSKMKISTLTFICIGNLLRLGVDIGSCKGAKITSNNAKSSSYTTRWRPLRLQVWIDAPNDKNMFSR